jgi:hypothetical protein
VLDLIYTGAENQYVLAAPGNLILNASSMNDDIDLQCFAIGDELIAHLPPKCIVGVAGDAATTDEVAEVRR